MSLSFTNIIVVIIASKEGWPINKLKVRQQLNLELTIIGGFQTYLNVRGLESKLGSRGLGKTQDK
jgi:hypothetical protein